jgi:DNA-binding transcriptional ArsR family regulator
MMMAAAGPVNLDETLMALADPTRRSILSRLSRGAARVTAVAAPFAISLNSVSKHIVVLERAGLVRRRRDGREHILSFDPAPLERAARWLGSQRALWAARLDELDRALRDDRPLEREHPRRRSAAKNAKKKNEKKR